MSIIYCKYSSKKFQKFSLALSFYFFFTPVSFLWGESVTFNEAARSFLETNAGVLESKAAVISYQAIEQQAASLSQPKLTLISYVAPIFKAEGDALNVTRDYSSWGPVVGADIEILWPIYSFGNIEILEDAAYQAKMAGEAIAKSEINSKLLEFKKLYLSLVMLKRLKPVLDEAAKTIDRVLTEAKRQFNEGQGEVQQRDIARLQIFKSEVDKFLSEWQIRYAQAQLGLGHYLGRSTSVEIAEDDFPELEASGAALDALLEQMWQANPDWQAVTRGLSARKGQLDAASDADLPVFFIGGRVSAAATAMRPDQDSPFANDPYNDLSAEVGIGFRWKWPDGTEEAVRLSAQAEYEKVQAKQKEARTGLPLQVFIAQQDLEHADRTWTFAAQKLKAASRWSFSELTAFEAGVGEAKNLLEGFAAALLAEKELIEAQYQYCYAWARLSAAIGDQATLAAWEGKNQ